MNKNCSFCAVPINICDWFQKGSVRTKYGTKEELLQAIATCHNYGLCVYIDLVMNHKAGADGTEKFEVIEVNPDNRMEDISEPFEIEGWTTFDFGVSRQ